MELHVKNNGLRSSHGRYKTNNSRTYSWDVCSIYIAIQENKYIYIYTSSSSKTWCHIYRTCQCHVKEPKVYHHDRFISLDSDPFLPSPTSPNPLLLGMIGRVGQNSARMRCQDVVGNLILSCLTTVQKSWLLP